MEKQRFNPEEYANLKHRVEALQSRVELDDGQEQETAKRLLIKIKKKIKAYEETYKIPHQQPENYDTSAEFDFEGSFSSENNEADKNYHEDTRSESEMIKDLGILYAIFGSTHQTTLNYHVFKIRFKKQTEKNGAFYRVYSDIYEDDIRICKDIIIGFWPARFGDDRCGDMEFSSRSPKSIEKYNNGCSSLYNRLLEGLVGIWNFYFENQIPMLKGPVAGYLESGFQSLTNNYPNIQLNQEQRKTIIEKTEDEIKSGKMKELECIASKLSVEAYKQYQTLSSFLEESGVVYMVDTSGVYIWDQKKFRKLVGYEYSTYRYYLFVL